MGEREVKAGRPRVAGLSLMMLEEAKMTCGVWACEHFGNFKDKKNKRSKIRKENMILCNF